MKTFKTYQPILLCICYIFYNNMEKGILQGSIQTDGRNMFSLMPGYFTNWHTIAQQIEHFKFAWLNKVCLSFQ